MTDYARIWRDTEKLPWVALVTTGRAGTDFFQSLLDSHPEILGFNGQLHFHRFWDSSIAARFEGALDTADITDEFVGLHIQKFKSKYDYTEKKGALGDEKNQSIDIDIQEFRSHIRKFLDNGTVNSRDFLRAIYLSYALCLKQDLGQKKIFFHHIHRITSLPPFRKDFPDCKVICMIRDFRANYVSGVEHWRKFNPLTDNPSYPVYIIGRAVDEANLLSDFDPDAVRVLRLEDLGDESVLRAVCAWMGVSYDPCMEQSTWGGLRWWGDKLSSREPGQNETGFAPSMIKNDWERRLGTSEKAALDFLLFDLLKHYRYPIGRFGNGFLCGVLVFFAILIPTRYERRFLAVSYLSKALARGEAKKVAAAFYHPARRIGLYYRWFFRRLFGHPHVLPWIAPIQPSLQ